MSIKDEGDRFADDWTPPGPGNSPFTAYLRCECGYWNYANAWTLTCEHCGRRWEKEGDFFDGKWVLVEGLATEAEKS